MARGRPDSLVLEKLPVKETTGRAPGPGPIQLSTWRIYAQRYISKAHLVLHTDAAKAYSKPIEGVLHTKVIHQKKKVNGKWVTFHQEGDAQDTARPSAQTTCRHANGGWIMDNTSQELPQVPRRFPHIGRPRQVHAMEGVVPRQGSHHLLGEDMQINISMSYPARQGCKHVIGHMAASLGVK